MEKYSTLTLTKNDGIAEVALSRPQLHNAFNETLIRELRDAFMALEKDEEVWAIILTGTGKSFCAGADLGWMKRMVNYTREEKITIVEMLWKNVYTDETLEKHEDNLVHKLSNLQRLSHKELIVAKVKILHAR